jgi:hypothetical protein
MLCPQRHTILATAGEADNRSAAETAIAVPLREFVAKLPAELRAEGDTINTWCGLCGSRSDTWICELRRTRYRTIDEARLELERLETEQMLAREPQSSRN